MKPIAVAILMLAALGCSGRHHDSSSPLPTVQQQADCQTCFPWTGHGPTKVICSPLVDTCQVNGVCFYHCGRQ